MTSTADDVLSTLKGLQVEQNRDEWFLLQPNVCSAQTVLIKRVYLYYVYILYDIHTICMYISKLFSNPEEELECYFHRFEK